MDHQQRFTDIFAPNGLKLAWSSPLHGSTNKGYPNGHQNENSLRKTISNRQNFNDYNKSQEKYYGYPMEYYKIYGRGPDINFGNSKKAPVAEQSKEQRNNFWGVPQLENIPPETSFSPSRFEANRLPKRNQAPKKRNAKKQPHINYPYATEYDFEDFRKLNKNASKKPNALKNNLKASQLQESGFQNYCKIYGVRRPIICSNTAVQKAFSKYSSLTRRQKAKFQKHDDTPVACLGFADVNGYCH